MWIVVSVELRKTCNCTEYIVSLYGSDISAVINNLKKLYPRIVIGTDVNIFHDNNSYTENMIKIENLPCSSMVLTTIRRSITQYNGFTEHIKQFVCSYNEYLKGTDGNTTVETYLPDGTKETVKTVSYVVPVNDDKKMFQGYVFQQQLTSTEKDGTIVPYIHNRADKTIHSKLLAG